MDGCQVPGSTTNKSHPLHSPATALLRLVSINCAKTGRLETSFAAGSSTPMHFLFPVKDPFLAPTQDRRLVILTPTAHRRCIFRKIFSPLKFFMLGPFPSPTLCLTPQTPEVTVNPKFHPTAAHPTPRRMRALGNVSTGNEELRRDTHEFSLQWGEMPECLDAWQAFCLADNLGQGFSLPCLPFLVCEIGD